MDAVNVGVLADLVTVREAADLLGVVPETVRSRIARNGVVPIRVGDRLLVRRDDLPRLDAPVRPPAPARSRSLTPMALATLRLLADWEEATADELAIGLERHPGNLRKYLTILRHQGLAASTPDPIVRGAPSWAVTQAGRDFLSTAEPTEAAA